MTTVYPLMMRQVCVLHRGEIINKVTQPVLFVYTYAEFVIVSPLHNSTDLA